MTHKRGRHRSDHTPEALAARLPEELKSFGLSTDIAAREAAIAEWIDERAPGQGEDLAGPVMVVAGLTYLSEIRARLTDSPLGN